MKEDLHQQRHQLRQQKLKAKVDARIQAATESRGIVIIYTGNGKGKTTAAFGTALRALGHGLKVVAIQFIKGQWQTGEQKGLESLGVEFIQMKTDFTWESQDRVQDNIAAQTTWQQAKQKLQDDQVDLVILDELTYMVTFDYIDLDEIIQAIKQRPSHQHVIITGRACHRTLVELADTVNEIKPLKHAFDAGIAAQIGIEW
ncbi:cob(I)yrinic acid a,c-diamide adenosyltransferase [Utexia brackfieldae]|uniref:cob(I)yrinic acid a,c-diamide adenosyltransferase n=1 Tax=Utexia brackfieldae TaxID=3074108 RepID=UPI00370DD86A